MATGAEIANIEVVENSLAKARKYYDDRNYGRSFAHYLVVFQLLNPTARREYEKEFITVLHLWGSILHRRGKYEDVFKCYHLAISYFPTSVEIINNLGVHALKLKCLKAAKMHFENALMFDPNYLPAEQNLQSAKYALVERWHFPMLNDILRNKSYANAIFLEISHGFRNILDVGTGTGILSLFASKSKQCESITACDYSDTMFEIATKVLEANNVTNINLIKKRSNNLVIPNDLKKKVDLLVTETLDSGIFGENILETLIHAWENLLKPFPYGKVIPAGVAIYVTGIQSSDLARKARLFPRENNILKLNEMCLSYCSFPYDTESLHSANVTYMTDTNIALYVNFNDINQLKTIATAEDIYPKIQLKCTGNGRIDAFAIWFNLNLNETISISNSPFSPKLCWDQAIHYLKHPLKAIENEQLNLQISCFEGYVGVECEESNELDLDSDDGKCFLVDKSVILFLNDGKLLNYLEKIANTLAEIFKTKKKWSVLDISPFPILGLLLLKNGAELTCRVKDKSAEKAIQHLCVINKISQDKITCIYEKHFNEFTNKDIQFDIIFQNLVSSCGLLFEVEIYQAQVMKCCLTPQGVYLPNKVSVWAEIVECDWLNRATRVDDKNVCGFKIAQYINEYQTTEQRDMNFNEIYHKTLSEPVNLGLIRDNVTNPHLNKTKVCITKNGDANAIFYWFKIELIEGINISTRRNKSFAQNAAFILDTTVELNVGDSTWLALKQHKGTLKIFVCDPD